MYRLDWLESLAARPRSNVDCRAAMAHVSPADTLPTRAGFHAAPGSGRTVPAPTLPQSVRCEPRTDPVDSRGPIDTRREASSRATKFPNVVSVAVLGASARRSVRVHIRRRPHEFATTIDHVGLGSWAGLEIGLRSWLVRTLP